MAKLRVNAQKMREDLGEAYQLRIDRAKQSEQYATALEQVKQALVDFWLLPTIEEKRLAGGFTKVFQNAVEQATQGMEEDAGMWGNANLIREALLSQAQEIRLSTQQALQNLNI